MRKIISICAVALLSLGLYAQDFQSGYFLEGFQLAYRLNPAFTDSTDFRSGLLSVANATWRSNIGLSDIFYPYQDKLVTALHKSVPTETVMNKFPKKGANMNASIEMGIFATGFKRGDVYHTVDVTLKYNGKVRLPYDYVSLLKEGLAERDFFDLSGVEAGVNNYLELSYGQTRQWGRLKYGVRVKPLIGLGFGRFHGEDLTVDATGRGWTQEVHADIEIAGGFVKYGYTPYKEGVRKIDIGSFRLKRYRMKFGGLGLALDLGAQYPVTDNFIVSASILDLGGMKWFDKVYGRSDAIYSYDPDKDEDPDETLQPVKEIADAFDFAVQEKHKNSFEMLPVSFNLGAQYKMPFNKNISAALLYTHKSYDWYGYNEVRLFGCWTPLKWLSVDLSGARHNFGWSLGGAFDVHAPGFNIFWGIDSYAFKVTPQMIPINQSNISMTLGVTFPLYRRVNR